jgi:hypothetical protein
MSTNAPAIEEIAPDFIYVDAGRRFPQARLVEPTSSGYLLLAAEVDRRPMFLPDSRPKRRLSRRVKQQLSTLKADDRVLEANLFDGLPTPARRGELLKQRPDVPVARFDLAVLVETTSPEAAADLEDGTPWKDLAAPTASTATWPPGSTPPAGSTTRPAWTPPPSCCPMPPASRATGSSTTPAGTGSATSCPR